MTGGLQMLIVLILIWAWFWPESVGRWLAEVRQSYAAARVLPPPPVEEK